jgi:Holliday junction DNA helicase RuvA
VKFEQFKRFVNACYYWYNISMISYLKGKILAKGLNFIVLDTGSIGYKVFVTPESLEAKIGDNIELYTFFKVTEDTQALFGLPDFETLQFFELLITVSGVGPKVALAVLSSATVNSIQQSIGHEDAALFTRISGVGQKTAERIILELKNKVGAVSLSGGANSDTFDALLALGYSQKEIREVIKKVDANLTGQKQLKQALQFLGNR